jgi:hypothetical protein
MTHSIGQVLFVVLTKKNQVYPMRIVEVITKKSLKGEDVRYALQAGPEKDSSIYLDQIDGEVFETEDKARSILIKRATQQINKLVDVAVEKSKQWYRDESIEKKSTDDLPDFSKRDESQEEASLEDSTVILPDGTIAKVKLPNV